MSVLLFSGAVCLLSVGTAAFARESPAVTRPLEQEKKSLTVGSFNLLHLGYGTKKNYPRMAQLIVDHGFDIFAGVEVMNPAGAQTLLQALRKASSSDWRLVLSAAPTGERRYKEYLAFYYRADRVHPLETAAQYCSREDLRGLDASPQSCFARDEHESGADFQRDPFVGHFAAGGHPLTLVAVHLMYGDQSASSIAKRQQESIALHREMDRMREATPEAEIVAVGDFNLQLEETVTMAPPPAIAWASFWNFAAAEEFLLSAHALFPFELFQGGHALAGLVTGPTTVGVSSYDHLLVYQDHLSQWADAITIEGADRKDPAAMALYKQEVSDHFPVQAVLKLPR